MKTIRLSAFLLVGAILSCFLLPASGYAAEVRIQKSISDESRTTLPASVVPWANKSRDLGEVSPDMPIPGITLVFSRSAAQEADLQTLLAAQQNPKSPLYRHWLTPDAFAARFGMSDDDIAQVKSWLTAHGFTIESVARNRDRITFSGTAAEVQQAFGTSLHHYQLDGTVHFAPSSALSLPAALAPVTATVLHLSDLRPKPSVHAIAKPQYTSSPGEVNYLGPKDVATMYGLAGLVSENLLIGYPSVAIVGQSYVNTGTPSSINTFQVNLTGYRYIAPVLVPGSGSEAISPGDEGESEIDLEYVNSVSSNATTFLVYVGANQNYGVYDSLSFAITENIAPVISISYGTCEPLMSTTDLDQYNALFEEAGAQGQTIVASSGDSGSTACAPYTTAEGVSIADQQSLSVNFPASSPYVTAVGGTQMAPGTFATGNTQYWANASGFDSTSSLLSYVPEVAWNEGSAANGILAGGGGSSDHYPRPSWQTSFPGMPSGSYRLLPDVAFQSSVESPGYIICTDDPQMLAEEGLTVSCGGGLTGTDDRYTIAGGTSFAAPIFAGYLTTLLGYEGGTGLGNINPILYQLASDASLYSSVFHDITSGSNACPAAASGCIAMDQSSYAATSSYDEATGLGSMDLRALMNVYPAGPAATLQNTVINAFPADSAYTASPGDTVAFQASVTSLQLLNPVTLPGGTVSVSIDGAMVASGLSLTPDSEYPSVADLTYSMTTPSATGSHQITFSYSGDSTHTQASTTDSIMVGNPLASGSFALTATNLTLANNQLGTSTVTITPGGGYNGRLTWSLSLTANSANSPEISGCYGIPYIPVNGVTTTTLTLGLGTACTSSSSDARAALRAVTVHRLTSSNANMPSGTGKRAFWTGASLCMLLCGCVGRRRRHWPLMAALLLLPLAGLGLSGCGGGDSTTTSSSGSSGTTSSYTATLTGTDSVNGAITAQANFTLTVN